MSGLNAPNGLTLARIGMAPVVALLLIGGGGRPSVPAAAVFLAAIVTDLFDGYLARVTHRITRFGQIMDPLADKLLIASALIPLTAFDRFPIWALATILVREVAVTALRAIRFRQGVVIPASRLGKVKMETQVVASTAAMLAGDPSAWWLELTAAVAVAATTISGAACFVVALRAQRPALGGMLSARVSTLRRGEHARA